MGGGSLGIRVLNVDSKSPFSLFVPSLETGFLNFEITIFKMNFELH